MTEWTVVPKEEFDRFIAEFSKPLTRDVTGICEPPMLTYNDFSEGKVWPESVVAKVVLYESYDKDGPPPYAWEPNVYYIEKPKETP